VFFFSRGGHPGIYPARGGICCPVGIVCAALAARKIEYGWGVRIDGQRVGRLCEGAWMTAGWKDQLEGASGYKRRIGGTRAGAQRNEHLEVTFSQCASTLGDEDVACCLERNGILWIPVGGR